MSLHCPARLLLLPPGRLADLVDALGHERLAAVYASDSGDGGRVAAEAARLLDLPSRTLAGLGGGAGAREAVESIADLHRGENVLVLCPPPLLAALAEHALGRAAPGSRWVVLECADDGWRFPAA